MGVGLLLGGIGITEDIVAAVEDIDRHAAARSEVARRNEPPSFGDAFAANHQPRDRRRRVVKVAVIDVGGE